MADSTDDQKKRLEHDLHGLMDDIATQIRRLLGQGLEGKVEARADDQAALGLVAAVNEVLDAARRADSQADAAVRERVAVDRALLDLEERLARETLGHESTARELRHKRSVLRHVVDSFPYCIFWKDRDGVYLGANRNKLRALGFESADQIIGKTDYETGVSKEEADFYRKVDKQVMESGEPVLNLEEIQRRADGPHVLLTSKIPLRDDGGEVIGILGMYVDVTARRRMPVEPEEVRRRLPSGASVWLPKNGEA